jgi:gas vesicle structural protein
MAAQQVTIDRAPRPSSLADVLDLILDKGLVIDAYVRVSVIGIEIVVIDARIVIASVDTYLRFAEAVNRLDLSQTKEATTYKDLVSGGAESMSEGGTKGVLEGMKDEMPWHDDDDKEPSTKPARNGQQQQGSHRGNQGNGSADGDGNGNGNGDKGFLGKLADRGRFSK